MSVRSRIWIGVALICAAATCRAADIRLDIAQLDRDRVLKAADQYLNESPVTITSFHAERSTGGLHDFFSEGDYWWPDPANPNGPYIQRDGMTNPDNFVKHRQALFRMCIQVPALASAFKITNDPKYAQHAIAHLRAWLIDEPTRMNPNLQYAQAIKGVSTGRGIGIIDTIHLIEVARSITLLEQSGLLAPDDATKIKKWFADYLEWMTTSKNGQDEKKAANNHGTCWLMQAAAFATLVGDESKLTEYRKRYMEVLLPNQFAADGSFPQELRRTKPYSYSLFNLDAMATICQILSTPADNLWTYSTQDGKNMKQAIDFMYPFIADKSKWAPKPDVMYWDKWPVRSPSLLFAGFAYREPQ